MKNVKLKLRHKKDMSYEILIHKGIAKKIPTYLKDNKIGQKYAIITDDFVAKSFGESLKKSIKNKGIKSEIFKFKKGEISKNLSTIEKLATEMVEKGFTRKDAIIALGGGVVGDAAGFLAAIYMRGIPYIHVPTTLMAMVDSSIGGKTGVDLEAGKNLIGTITQPKTVFIDIDYLKNLPEKQIRNGLAEVIKYGAIGDKKLFKFIEQNIGKIFKKDSETLNFIITRSVKNKVAIVKKDEEEKTGFRIFLNYGHTYGHALERMSGYKLLHGYAISIGMVLANDIAVKKGIIKEKVAERIKNLLKKAGLPVTTIKKPAMKDLIGDKKREDEHINFILVKKIGKAVIYKERWK
ncbi:MAG: 3-dehydroquinate synthase [bacterium]|nr:3-dehydroquinate synthase [bacterium]